MTQKPSGLRCSYGWGIDDGDSLDDFLLVRLGTGSVDIADDGRHAGLVAHSGGKVDGLLGVILGEAIKDQKWCWLARSPAIRLLLLASTWTKTFGLFSSRGRIKNLNTQHHLRLDLSAVAGCSLSRQVSQRTVTGSLELKAASG